MRQKIKQKEQRKRKESSASYLLGKHSRFHYSSYRTDWFDVPSYYLPFCILNQNADARTLTPAFHCASLWELNYKITVFASVHYEISHTLFCLNIDFHRLNICNLLSKVIYPNIFCNLNKIFLAVALVCKLNVN